jgi:hypothetical protein
MGLNKPKTLPPKTVDLKTSRCELYWPLSPTPTETYGLNLYIALGASIPAKKPSPKFSPMPPPKLTLSQNDEEKLDMSWALKCEEPSNAGRRNNKNNLKIFVLRKAIDLLVFLRVL